MRVAYDEKLAERIRDVLGGRRGVTERKMFGGIAFMLHGNMICGIVRDDLMVRVGPDAYDAALREKHTRPMDFNGRPMRGMVYVVPAGIGRRPSLVRWVERGAAYAGTLPKK
jgi:TfoX/Sxy family transcriptional regulator of competence genes